MSRLCTSSRKSFRRPKVNESRLAVNDHATVRLPYPDGWYFACFVDELEQGRVLTRELVGEEIVIYRTQSGVICATKPYCPHMGAHLGHGGCVDGETIVCPFHGFAFDADGKCVRNAYGTKPPPNANLETMETREIAGIVLIWLHAHKLPPQWEIYPRWDHMPTARRVDTIIDHPQDIVENAVDWGHFPVVHGVDVRDYTIDMQERTLRVSARVSPARKARSFLTYLKGRIDAEFQGLGWGESEAEFPTVRFVMWILVAPRDPIRVDLAVAVHVRKFLWFKDTDKSLISRLILKIVSELVVTGLTFDTRRDYHVWQNKIYVEHPKLAKGDGPIINYRKWATQFYSTVPVQSLPREEPEQENNVRKV